MNCEQSVNAEKAFNGVPVAAKQLKGKDDLIFLKKIRDKYLAQGNDEKSENLN
jgi:hypothetical protein|nr:hypothetical protein [uncultured Acetatifactor sp.]